MPELPEVETIVRKLRPVVENQRLRAVRLLWPPVVDRPDPHTFLRHVTGARVTSIDRRGKFLIFALDSGEHLLVHLRMSGKFTLRRQDEGPGNDAHTRARLQLADGTWVNYVDQRKFGRFYLVKDPAEVVEALGPEPLGAEFTAAALCQRLEGRRGEIKRLLLNQNFIAGLGNIYVNEALWRAQVHPQRVAGSLSEIECRQLHEAIVTVLEQGIRHGGTSLEDRAYVYPDGGLGGHQDHLHVYDRAGEPCPRCGADVQRIVQGQRSTYYCPACQREEGNADIATDRDDTPD